MTSPVSTYNLEIVEGNEYSLEVTWNDSLGDPIDVTGYTASLRIGRKDAVSLEITEADYIDVGGVNGKFIIGIPASVTENIPSSKFYDFDITSPTSVVTRLLTGKVNLTQRAVPNE